MISADPAGFARSPVARHAPDLPDEKRFVLVANRFRWEAEPDGEPPIGERMLRLCFDDVTAVQRQAASRRTRATASSSCWRSAPRDGPDARHARFRRRRAAMRLEVGQLLCHLEDIGEPWPTPWRPAPSGRLSPERRGFGPGGLAEHVVQSEANETLILALPKGRILEEAAPLLARAGIEPEPDFDDRRRASSASPPTIPSLDVIRVRSFDVATFVAFGAAHLGIAGTDVLMEFDYPGDLRAARSRHRPLPARGRRAGRDGGQRRSARWSHVRVATKYPEITRRHFAARGVQAECIKLNGAMELAPQPRARRRIVDLVQTGRTLRANGLVEIEHIADITSRLIVNRAALKTRPERGRRAGSTASARRPHAA